MSLFRIPTRASLLRRRPSIHIIKAHCKYCGHGKAVGKSLLKHGGGTYCTRCGRKHG